MHVTFLGTGTSHGIPMIGCDCAVCRSDNPRNKRLRPSIYVECENQCLLVDATPDLRTQALRANIRRVDAVLMTHTHADHVLGLDDLRAFTARNGRRMPIYGSPHSVETIRRVFPYACTETPAWAGLPSFEMHAIEPHQDFEVGGLKLRALPLLHGRMTVYGFLFGREMAYVTDCNVVPPEVVGAIRGVTLLVLDALRHRPHPAHLTIDQARAVAEQVKASLTLFTHLCHEADHEAVEQELPPHVRVAYDGMKMEVSDDRVRQVA
ncbi:MAG TPA: MBL fold metallo-hydrolase [Verrucomicrobiae bacterium]|nr:MBL fold metallo-hydrolase [Verrucomicrobiae bacterium]